MHVAKHCVRAYARMHRYDWHKPRRHRTDRRDAKKTACAHTRASTEKICTTDTTAAMQKTLRARIRARDSKEQQNRREPKIGTKITDYRGGGASGARRSAGGARRAKPRAGFRAVLPACAPAVNSRKHWAGDHFPEQRPENEHRAGAPRAATNQGFEGSKCYILIRNKIVGSR